MRKPPFVVAVVDSRNDIDLTPMLDVVFILLIFFVVTANFLQEAGLDVNPPVASHSGINEQDSILVTIDQDHQIWIRERTVDWRTLKDRLIGLHAETPDASLVIHAHDGSANRQLVRVLDASRQAGIYAVAIASGEPT